MKIVTDKNRLERLIKNEKNLGFVPTMGALHKGHEHLIKKCNSKCHKTIVSIFVNKPQFNEKNDFNRYPRILKKDIKILNKLKIDFLYIPKEKQIYPKGPNTKLRINPFEKKLCGKLRPGHFKAVVDVIDRFIKIIKPNKIFLGEKDMQQLKIIENFVLKKYKNIEIIPCKIIREKSGIAYSSRNILLSKKEKMIASKIYKTIKKIKKKILLKKLNKKSITNFMIKLGVKKIDYVEILNINKITKPFVNGNKYKIFIAYYLSKTRLIDNI